MHLSQTRSLAVAGMAECQMGDIETEAWDTGAHNKKQQAADSRV